MPTGPVAHWDSQADLEAAWDSSAFQDRLSALRADPESRFSANPAVYEVIAELGEHSDASHTRLDT